MAKVGLGVQKKRMKCCLQGWKAKYVSPCTHTHMYTTARTTPACGWRGVRLNGSSTTIN